MSFKFAQPTQPAQGQIEEPITGKLTKLKPGFSSREPYFAIRTAKDLYYPILLYSAEAELLEDLWESSPTLRSATGSFPAPWGYEATLNINGQAVLFSDLIAEPAQYLPQNEENPDEEGDEETL